MLKDLKYGYVLTINPRIRARGAYFKFRKRRGELCQGEGVWCLSNFSQIVPDMIVFLIDGFHCHAIKK